MSGEGEREGERSTQTGCLFLKTVGNSNYVAESQLNLNSSLSCVSCQSQSQFSTRSLSKGRVLPVVVHSMEPCQE